MWYKKDFSSEMSELSTENEGILHVIQDSTSGDMQKSLTEMLQLDSVHGYSESIGSTVKCLLFMALLFCISYPRI